ncbi:MAG TPA: shikimate kinase [Atribacteraceae bacterium]|nr:shikimate kinase [Atribacteraceae bacterium]
MGSGKTRVGKVLAQSTGWTFLDLDALIVEKTNCSIPEIFSRYGEGYFRELETETLREKSSLHQTVLSTGGGLPGREENWKILERSYLTVYLKCTFNVCYKRIFGDRNRPLLAQFPDRQSLLALYQKRIPYYERSRVIIDTAHRTPNAIAREIVLRARTADSSQG